MPGPTVTTPPCAAATNCPARRSGRPTSGPERAWCWPGSPPTGSPRCTRWSTSIADTRTSWRTCRSWAVGSTGSGRTRTVDPTGVPGRAGDYGVRVRLVVARCSVDYVGRLTAHLDPAVRLLMVKADGSVLVHADRSEERRVGKGWGARVPRVQEKEVEAHGALAGGGATA